MIKKYKIPAVPEHRSFEGLSRGRERVLPLDCKQKFSFCMLAHVSDENICPALMKSMVEYAKKFDSSFNGVTVGDLQNKTAFHRLHKDYVFLA